MTWKDQNGTEHWCSKDKYGYVNVPCLGILYSCGHSFSCNRDPAVIEHDKKHERESKRDATFFAIVFGLFFAVLLFEKVRW